MSTPEGKENAGHTDVHVRRFYLQGGYSTTKLSKLGKCVGPKGEYKRSLYNLEVTHDAMTQAHRSILVQSLVGSVPAICTVVWNKLGQSVR